MKLRDLTLVFFIVLLAKLTNAQSTFILKSDINYPIIWAVFSCGIPVDARLENKKAHEKFEVSPEVKNTIDKIISDSEIIYKNGPCYLSQRFATNNLSKPQEQFSLLGPEKILIASGLEAKNISSIKTLVYAFIDPRAKRPNLLGKSYVACPIFKSDSRAPILSFSKNNSLSGPLINCTLKERE